MTDHLPPTLSLADVAYHGIIELIRDGRLGEHDHISHRRLADQLNMSKLPVGSALKRLEREGLVSSSARVGTRINRIDSKAAWDLLQWRVAVESQTARLANEWMTEKQGEALLRQGILTDERMEQGHPDWRRDDVAFHLMVAELSRVRSLRTDLERLNIYDLKLQLCEAVHATAAEPPQASPNHETLARTIASGTLDGAEQCMRAHLEMNPTVYGFVQWFIQKHGGHPRDYEVIWA